MVEIQFEKTETNKLIYAFTGLNIEEYMEKLLNEFNDASKEKETA